MAIYSSEISLSTKGKCDIKNITEDVQDIVEQSKINIGHVMVFAVGSTGAITTIEFEPGLEKDLKDFLQKLFPYNYPYRHHNTWGDDNGSSHIQAAFIGPSLAVPVIDSKLALGTWQQIVFLDLDTRARQRKIIVQIFS